MLYFHPKKFKDVRIGCPNSLFGRGGDNEKKEYKRKKSKEKMS